MKNINTNKSSTNQIQSSIFISNLRKEMDKMSQNCRKKEMIKTAHEYIKSGISRKETEELLQLDGYDSDMSKSLMSDENFVEEFASDTAQRWGFDIEDVHGRIFSSRDFGIVITASSEEEANAKAEEEIEKLSTLELDSITNIYKV